jgi:hypothetical protein
LRLSIDPQDMERTKLEAIGMGAGNLKKTWIVNAIAMDFRRWNRAVSSVCSLQPMDYQQHAWMMPSWMAIRVIDYHGLKRTTMNVNPGIRESSDLKGL